MTRTAALALTAAAGMALACTGEVLVGRRLAAALGTAEAEALSLRELRRHHRALDRHLGANPADALARDLREGVEIELHRRGDHPGRRRTHRRYEHSSS